MALLATKSGSTLDLITKLDLSARGWTLMGHWTADRWVLGFARQEDAGRRVFVAAEEATPGRYVYQCEGGAENETGRGLNLDDLVEVLERVLDT